MESGNAEDSSTESGNAEDSSTESGNARDSSMESGNARAIWYFTATYATMDSIYLKSIK